MRNRAKCKLCKDIIESLHHYDYVTCSCGEISVDGGLDMLRVSAKSFENFIRIDDLGNEIPVKVIEKDLKHDEVKADEKIDHFDTLNMMIKTYEELPSSAMQAPVTHHDLYSVLVLLSELLPSCKPLS